jgi:dephospho-CoA kinase
VVQGQPAVPFVGLTGGMGAGKSLALSALERLGAVVLSTDAVVHQLYGAPQVRKAVIERWGEQVAPAGIVDRAAVAAKAFEEDSERQWLEGLLWPLVGKHIAEWLAQARAATPLPRAAIVEVPLLFEAGMEAMFDATIAVVAEEELRRERAARRGHVLADERVARQLPQEEKAARATFAVHNDGSEQELVAKLSAILDKLEE